MLAHIHPSLRWFTCEYRPNLNGLAYPDTASRTIQGPPRAQSPFARWRRYLHRRDVSSFPSEGVTPPSSLIWAHATDQNPPADFGLPYTAGPGRLLSVPAGSWSFPTLSLQSLHGCLDPYPGMPLRCLCPFLPEELQPHPRCTEFGAPNHRRNATSTATPLSRRQSFRYVQAPMLASPPDGTHHTGSKSCGQPGRLRHAMDWTLPPRTVVSLHDRIGQLS
jgi:hypothetical protein